MENRLYDVLVLAPFTDEGKIVLKQAMYLQKSLSFRFFVLHIIPPIHFFKRAFNSGKIKELKDKALHELNAFVRDFYGGEIPNNVILKVIMGDLIKTLITQSQSGDFYFMILKRSTHQKGISNLLNQNEIDKIIGHSYCPVLSINEDATPENLESILIPIDISESTDKKLLWASLFAQESKAKIQIVSALNINIDEQKSLAAKNAEKIKKMLQERKIECEVKVLKTHNQPKHEVVLNFIAEKKPDMIIIRKHHIASYASKTIGDFAKEIIHGSKIPVFTVSQSQSDIANILPLHTQPG